MVFAAVPAQTGIGPYGPLLPPDANGFQLAVGFWSRVIAITGQPVGSGAAGFDPPTALRLEEVQVVAGNGERGPANKSGWFAPAARPPARHVAAHG